MSPEFWSRNLCFWLPREIEGLRRQHGYGDAFFGDEVFVRIRSGQRYLWRAGDQEGEIVDALLQERRDAEAAIGCWQCRSSG